MSAPTDALPWAQLLEAAGQARLRAHAPYSRFAVGAALLSDKGQVISGCNVENASYGLSVCAERNAIARMVNEGGARLLALAVVVDSASPTPPCGACRQVLAEFADASVPVVCRTPGGEELRVTLGELLPHAFTRDFL